MEEKKRTLLAIVISCIILLAVVYSFGLNFFGSPPDIVIADPDGENSSSAGPDDSGEQGGIPVEVTPETVQSIIAGMSRYRSYSRTISVKYSWESGSGAVTAQVMVDGGWSRCDVTLASGMVERSITGDGSLWYWYDESTDYLEIPAGDRAEDLSQYIPTYEDILALATEDILETGYEEKGGVPAIYVEARGQNMEYLERYWVSVTSGLLVAAETVKDGGVVYEMSSGDMVSPLSGGEDVFTLPDGTVLYTPQG